MPYTLVHPAFVLPLNKWKAKWFSFDALLIGSFVPDFDIIFRFTENRFHIYTFSFINILTIILPIGILSFILYTLFLKRTVEYIFHVNFPDKVEINQITYYAKVASSLLLAILFHLLLDRLTHPDSNDIIVWFKNQSPLPFVSERMKLFSIYGPLIISSLLGAIILIIILLKNQIFTTNYILKLVEGNRKYFWILFIILFMIFFGIKLNLNGLEKGFHLDSYLLISLSGIFYGFIIATLIFSTLFKKTSFEN